MGEAIFAGGFAGENNDSYWLYTGQYYWTMTPSYVYSGSAVVSYVGNHGNLGNGAVQAGYGARPVINLKANTNLVLEGSGTPGTVNNPYIVK